MSRREGYDRSYATDADYRDGFVESDTARLMREEAIAQNKAAKRARLLPQQLFMITQHGETSYYENTSEFHSDSLIRKFRGMKTPFTELSEYGRSVSEACYAECEQNSHLKESIEFNIDQDIIKVFNGEKTKIFDMYPSKLQDKKKTEHGEIRLYKTPITERRSSQTKDQNPYWTMDHVARDRDVKTVLDHDYTLSDYEKAKSQEAIFGEYIDEELKDVLTIRSDKVFDYIHQAGKDLSCDQLCIDTGRYLEIGIKSGQSEDRKVVYECPPDGKIHEFWHLDEKKGMTVKSYMESGQYRVISQITDPDQIERLQAVRDDIAHREQVNMNLLPGSVNDLLDKNSAFNKMRDMGSRMDSEQEQNVEHKFDELP